MFTWQIISWLLKDHNTWLFKYPIAIMKEMMSWLFKDSTVTVVWLNFSHVQSNSKKWPKKIKFYQITFFLEKQLLKFPFTYQLLSFRKILKKFLEPIQSFEYMPLSGLKWSICPAENFLGKNH